MLWFLPNLCSIPAWLNSCVAILVWFSFNLFFTHKLDQHQISTVFWVVINIKMYRPNRHFHSGSIKLNEATTMHEWSQLVRVVGQSIVWLVHSAGVPFVAGVFPDHVYEMKSSQSLFTITPQSSQSRNLWWEIKSESNFNLSLILVFKLLKRPQLSLIELKINPNFL